MSTVLKIVTTVLPEILGTVVALFNEADDNEGGVLAGLIGEGLARVIPDATEDEIGRFLVAVGDQLVQANPPQDGGQ